jgi:glycosyltransferase involved in cell wall biosynthesis
MRLDAAGKRTPFDMGSDVTVDIICSVLNGERFLPDFLASLERQTHDDWALWLRDDGSTDATVALFEAAAARDERIRILHVGGPRLGAAGSFGWALERVPATSRYVMTADADDVWLPRKIEVTLAAMLAEEKAHGTEMPILVHSDLTVVDADLRVRHPSFWRYVDLRPEPATLRRLVVRNVATGPTVLLNAALRSRIGTTPAAATHHDWWYALVAAATGRIVAVHEPTVLYRQHGANDVGARAREAIGFANAYPAIRAAVERTDVFRAWIRKTAGQAEALLARYGDELSDADRTFLAAYSQIPTRSFLRRKLDVLRLRALPEYGVLRTIGAVLRG